MAMLLTGVRVATLVALVLLLLLATVDLISLFLDFWPPMHLWHCSLLILALGLFLATIYGIYCSFRDRDSHLLYFEVYLFTDFIIRSLIDPEWISVKTMPVLVTVMILAAYQADLIARRESIAFRVEKMQEVYAISRTATCVIVLIALTVRSITLIWIILFEPDHRTIELITISSLAVALTGMGLWASFKYKHLYLLGFACALFALNLISIEFNMLFIHQYNADLPTVIVALIQAALFKWGHVPDKSAQKKPDLVLSIRDISAA